MDASGKVLLTRLYQKESTKGNTYFAGRIGAAKVVMLRDDHAEVTDGTTAVWQVFVQDGDEKPRQTHQDRKPSSGGRQSGNASLERAAAAQAPFLNDPIPDFGG